MDASDGYKQAIDVLSQLRVGNVIGDSLRSQARDVIENAFSPAVAPSDVDMFNTLLTEQKVTGRLRDHWADAVLDIWHVNEGA